MAAATVNNADLQTRAGTCAAFMRAILFPMILGWDVVKKFREIRYG